MLLIQMLPAIPSIWQGFIESDSVHLHFQHGGEQSSLPGCVSPSDTVHPVVGMKPDDSGVVIGYEVNECTHT